MSISWWFFHGSAMGPHQPTAFLTIEFVHNNLHSASVVRNRGPTRPRRHDRVARCMVWILLKFVRTSLLTNTRFGSVVVSVLSGWARCRYADIWLRQLRCAASACFRGYLFGVAMSLFADRILQLENIQNNLHHAPVVRNRDPRRALKHHRVVTCVIWFLSQSTPLAEAYVLSKGLADTLMSSVEYSPQRAVLVFTTWLVAESQLVLEALSNLENAHRIEADCFLVRSLTAEVVQYQNRKGVLVTTSDAIYHYLRFWSLRSVPTDMQPVLRKLTHHRNARRKFGQLLRREWMLDYGSFKAAAELSEQEIRQRARVRDMCNETC